MKEIILIFIIFLILLGYLEFKKNNIIYVKSKNGDYQLVRNLHDREKSAELLSKIKERLTILCKYVYEKYKNNEKHNKSVIRLNYRFDVNNIQESLGEMGYTSYSVNKGEEIHFCLRDKNENEDLHPINTLMFVAIHELAHIMSLSLGHNEEFKRNFKFLLKRAIEIGVYKKKDYSKENVKFCGMEIKSTPLN